MTKTLLLALSLGVFVGCADDTTTDTVDTEVIEPAAPVTEPTDDLVEDSTMMDDTMMDGDVMEGDAGLDETMDDEGAMEEEMMDEEAM